MMRWNKIGSIILGLIVICLVQINFNSSTASAIRPNANGCIEYPDGIVCPDLYCSADISSATCSTDGQQCYCKPLAFQGSTTNRSCEIAFGSKMYYVSSGLKPKDAVIYLSGGVWNSVIAAILESSGSAADLRNNYDIETQGAGQDKTAIIFRYQSGEKVQHFTSRFLNAIANEGDQKSPQNWKIGFDAQINVAAGTGKIFNQTFENNSQVCGVSTPLNGAENSIFYHKQSKVIDGTFNKEEVACIKGPKILSSLILPTTEKSFFFFNKESKPEFNVSRNCTAIDANKILPAAIREMDKVAGSLVVPSNRVRQIYRQYQANYYLGEVFDRAYSPTDIAARQAAIDRILKYCDTTCSLEKIQAELKLDSAEDARQYLPYDCVNCQDKTILNELKANPTLSYNDLVADSLIQEQNQCRLISPSYGFFKSGTNQPKYSSTTESRVINDKLKAEDSINKQLPFPLISACEDRFGADDAKRVDCKANALKCYQASLTPDLRSADLCSVLDKEGLSTSKWITCPILTTSTLAADGASKKIDDVLKVNPSILSGASAKKIWGNFRDVANIGLALLIIAVVGSQITSLGLSNYHIKKMIGKIVLAIILINFSLTISQIILDAGNIIGASISTFFQSLTPPALVDTPETISDFIMITALGTAGIGGVGLILGVMGVVLPLLIIAIVGVVSVVILLSIRQTLIIVLALISPFAFLLLIIPSFGEKGFSAWMKTYLASVFLYPISQLVYASSKLAYEIIWSLESKNGSVTVLKIIGYILPILAMASLPFLYIALLKSSSKLSAKLASGYQSSTSNLQNLAKKHYQKSAFAKSLTGYTSKSWQRFASGQGRGIVKGTISRAMGGALANKGFNTLTSGAGGILKSRGYAVDNASVRSIVDAFDGDYQLAAVVIKDKGQRGALYQNLTSYQKQKYDRIMAMSQMSGGSTAQLAAIQVMAGNGVSNYELYNQAFTNARQLGADDNQIQTAAAMGMSKAKGNGDVETMGYMFAVMFKDLKAANLTPPKKLEDLSNELLGIRIGGAATGTTPKSTSKFISDIIKSKGDLSQIDDSTLSPDQLSLKTDLASRKLSARELVAAATLATSKNVDLTGHDARKDIKKGIELLALGWDKSGIAGKETAVNESEINQYNLDKDQVKNIAFAKSILLTSNYNLEMQFDIDSSGKKVIKPKKPLKIVQPKDPSKKKASDKPGDFDKMLNNLLYSSNEDILVDSKKINSANDQDTWHFGKQKSLEPTYYNIKENINKSIDKINFQDHNPIVYQSDRQADRLAGEIIGDNQTYQTAVEIIKDTIANDRTSSSMIQEATLKWNYMSPEAKRQLEPSLRKGWSEFSADPVFKEAFLDKKRKLDEIFQAADEATHMPAGEDYFIMHDKYPIILNHNKDTKSGIIKPEHKTVIIKPEDIKR